MKLPNLTTMLYRGVCASLALILSGNISHATPYATSLTNNAGIVSFRLNQTTGTNDSVFVISSGGAVTNVIQSPGGPVLTRGLIVTNLGVASGVIKVEIKHTGSGVISSNSPMIAPATGNINFRGVTANLNPASPYFGWVYASAGSKATANLNGVYAYFSDLSPSLNQGATNGSGGYSFNSSGYSPYRITVGPDDNLIVPDGSAASGNLLSISPTLTNFSYILKPISGAITAGGPVGTNNNHGEVVGGVFVGTGTNRVLYTMDESYQADPTTSGSEWNSVWRYSIGTNALPYTNAPDAKVMSPFLYNFQGQNEGLQTGHNGYEGYLYVNQRRSNPPQYSIYIVDTTNLVNVAPNTQGGYFWDSQTESIAEGYSDDVTRDVNQITVSQDGKWLAGLVAAGSSTIFAPDGSSFANAANDIILLPLTNGIPNLAGRQVYRIGGAGNGRDIQFDAANNLYIASSGLGVIQSFDIGETTDATTGSDGTFTITQPSVQVTATATIPQAYQAGQVPGQVTFTRAANDLSNPQTVFFSLSGTANFATNGGYTIVTNATTTTNSVVIPAGQTSASVQILPNPYSTPQLTLTAILTVKGSGGYSIGFPASAVVSIADNSTPQLRLVGISTNVFQGTTNDYATLLIRRYGDTNVTLTLNAGNFAFGGTATLGSDFYLGNLPLTIPAGTVTQPVTLIYPSVGGSTNVGALSIIVTNLAGTGYTVTNNVTNTTLTLSGVPPEVVIYSNNFENDILANTWTVNFASFTNGSQDYTIVDGYDYTSGSIGNLAPIPPAPHSTNGDTKGLYMTVNTSAGIASGLNLYLKNHNFSGNYAVRFDMYLVRNSSGSAQSQSENCIFGINHDGLHTNWFRNSQPGTDLPGSATASDGLWFDIGADGAGGGGANTDFGAWSSPTYTNNAGVIGPTNFWLALASTETNVFKKPPFDSGKAVGGIPANTVLNSTPTWAQVEVSQVGNLITWKINNSVIYSYTNVPTTGGASIYTNGTIMLGYVDPWDDLGNGSANSKEACVIYDNLRVVALNPPSYVSGPTNVIAGIGTNVSFATTLAATATGTTNYQWQFNGTNIAGATNPVLSFGVLSTSFGTNAYRLQSYDGAYYGYSTPATLLPPTPTITSGPDPRAGVIGGSVSFTVSAKSFSGATNYQWLFGTNNLTAGTGATTATVTVTNVQSTNFGSFYSVVVSDGYSSVTSSVASLSGATSPAAVSASSNTTFRISYPTQVGPAYVVEYKTNLHSTNWVAIATNSGSGGTITVSDTETNSPTKFYRVRLK